MGNRKTNLAFTANGGTLTLTGANTYSGGTTVSGGVLQGNSTSLQGNILNNASVVFDQAENRLHIQKAILVWLLGGGVGRLPVRSAHA